MFPDLLFFLALPKDFINRLPDLNQITVKAICGNEVETSIVNQTMLSFLKPIKRTTYEGYNAIAINTT